MYKEMITLGSILMIIGCLVSIVGFGQAGSTRCECPVAIGGQDANCPCEHFPQQQMGYVITYVGIVIALSGVGFIAKSMTTKHTTPNNRQNLK